MTACFGDALLAFSCKSIIGEILLSPLKVPFQTIWLIKAAFSDVLQQKSLLNYEARSLFTLSVIAESLFLLVH